MLVFKHLRNETLLYLGPGALVAADNRTDVERLLRSSYLELLSRPWNSWWCSELTFIAQALLQVPSVFELLSSQTDRESYLEYFFESLDYRWKGTLTDDLWKSKYYPEDRYGSMQNKSFALKTVGDALLLLALVNINSKVNEARERDGTSLPFYSHAGNGKASQLCNEAACNKTLARLYDLLDLSSLVPAHRWIRQSHAKLDERTIGNIVEHCLALLFADEEPTEQGMTPEMSEMIARCNLHVLRWLAMDQLVH